MDPDLTDPDDPRTDAVIKLAKRKAQLNLLLSAFFLLITVGVVTCLLLIIVQTGRIAEIQGNNRDLFQRIVSCTDPEGDCYLEGQARTGEAVGTINEVTILAAACAKLPSNDTEAEIRACIEAGLNG